MALRREPTIPGPVTDLFDQLHTLHFHAGEPGVRQIAAGIGRGVISYTTVHNMFRGPRVPRWGHLELLVEQLGGDVEYFRRLWKAARQAEHSSERSTGGGFVAAHRPTREFADPMVQRRRLSGEMRRLRELSGLPRPEVGARTGWPLAKVMRIESGAIVPAAADVDALLDLYGVADAARLSAIVAMAEVAREPPWWTAFGDVADPDSVTYLAYESSARAICSFEPLLVPGLLQTEGYMRATLAEMGPHLARTDNQMLKLTDTRVELRLERQRRIFRRSDPPRLIFALDEAVIRRWVGGREVMHDQLTRLRDALVDPALTVWIVPYSAGLYQRQRDPYIIFELPDDEGEVIYFESARGDSYVRDDLHLLSGYLEAFWRIEQIGLRDEACLALVDSALAALRP